MVDDGSAATAMLGLPGFVLLTVSDHGGELEQAIETPAFLHAGTLHKAQIRFGFGILSAPDVHPVPEGPLVIPRSRATSAMGLPVSSTICTASALNCGLNFLRCSGMDGSSQDRSPCPRSLVHARPTEAMNPLIKKIERVGHGFRNVHNYRLRLLLHCGVDWHTPQPTRIRGWLPRLAA